MGPNSHAFLCHANGDKGVVKRIAAALEVHGISTFLDEWHLTPGKLWKEELNEAIAGAKSVVFFHGREVGPWQLEELYIALDRAARRDGFEVIPVILEGADHSSLQPQLRQRTWVDFSAGITSDGIAKLARGISSTSAVHHPPVPTSTARIRTLRLPPGLSRGVAATIGGIALALAGVVGLRLVDGTDDNAVAAAEALVIAQASLAAAGANSALSLALAGEAVGVDGAPLAVTAALARANEDFGTRVVQQIRDPIPTHESTVRSVASSAQGDLVVTGGDDGEVRLWSAPTFEELERLSGHTGAVHSVATSPDGQLIASAGSDATVRVWRISSGQEVCHFDGHSDVVWSVAFRNATEFVSTSSDGSLSATDALSCEAITSVDSAHQGSVVLRVAVSADGGMIATGAADGSVRLWDATSLEPVGTGITAHDSETYALAFRHDGTRLATGGADRTIRVWPVPLDDQPVASLEGHTNSISDLIFSPTGGTLFSASADQTLGVWNLDTTEVVSRLMVGHNSPVASLTSLGASELVSGATDGRLIRWDTSPGTPTSQVIAAHDHAVASVALSDDNDVVALGSFDGTIQLRDRDLDLMIDPIHSDGGPVFHVEFGFPGMLLSAGDSRAVEAWGIDSGELWGSFGDHNSSISSVLLVEESSTVVTGGYDGRVRYWDLRSGDFLFESVGHTAAVLGLAQSASGDFIVSGGDDGRALVWDSSDGTQIGRPIEADIGAVFAVTVRSDDGVIATAGEDGAVRLWDVEDRHELAELRESESGASYSVAFAPGSDLLASGHADGGIRLWDTRAQAAVGETLRGHDASVFALVFTSDANTLYSGDWNGRLGKWFVNFSGEAACEKAEPYVSHRQLDEALGPDREPQLCEFAD